MSAPLNSLIWMEKGTFDFMHGVVLYLQYFSKHTFSDGSSISLMQKKDTDDNFSSQKESP